MARSDRTIQLRSFLLVSLALTVFCLGITSEVSKSAPKTGGSDPLWINEYDSRRSNVCHAVSAALQAAPSLTPRQDNKFPGGISGDWIYFDVKLPYTVGLSSVVFSPLANIQPDLVRSEFVKAIYYHEDINLFDFANSRMAVIQVASVSSSHKSDITIIEVPNAKGTKSYLFLTRFGSFLYNRFRPFDRIKLFLYEGSMYSIALDPILAVNSIGVSSFGAEAGSISVNQDCVFRPNWLR